MKKIKAICLVINLLIFSTLVSAQYNVGNDDGFAFSSKNYNLSEFTPYNVGNDDGFAFSSKNYNLSELTPYNVGNDDGFAYSVLGSWGNEVGLPIELLWFTAECDVPIITLKWATASETNNDFFSIERSVDGINFSSVSTIPGAGSSDQTLYYSFRDEKGFGDAAYYRLKQTDFDGQYAFSEIVSVSCNGEIVSDIKAYPNPVTNDLTIEVAGHGEAVNVEIINASGAIVYKNSFIQKTIVETSQLLPGSYIIKFESGNILEFRKVLKQ